ncbi:MAG: glutamate 5-kinase [Alphaproteobacteria bacterium]
MTIDIGGYKKIIVKVGSALLVANDEQNHQGGIRHAWLETLAADIADMKKKGHRVVVVSSGASPLGRMLVRQSAKLESTAESLEMKQAVSAIGQIPLMAAWRDAFAKHQLLVAQILLTQQDTEERHRHLNGRATIENLLSLGVIPIINENDSVATDELKYGDNDRLSARVGSMISADLLILLSDVDGLYDKNPKINKNAKHIDKVDNITESIMNLARTSHDVRGTGGMITKLLAGKIANGAGMDMIITAGLLDYPLQKCLANEVASTIFFSRVSAMTARKKWIAGLLSHEGEMVIDDGALKALQAGKSLLSAGVQIIQTKSGFEKGAAILIKNLKNQRVGVGLINHDSVDAIKMVGKKSSEIKKNFDRLMKTELIDRDNLVLD